MAKTTPMRLVELLVLNSDIDSVLCYLGTFGEFQFQENIEDSSAEIKNIWKEKYKELDHIRISLGLEPLKKFDSKIELPLDSDIKDADRFIELAHELESKEKFLLEQIKSVKSAYDEASAFSKLNVSYSKLESLSFLTLRIGKINPEKFTILKERFANKAVVMSLGEDNSRILVAASKNTPLALDTELALVDFVPLELGSDFKGIPKDALSALELKSNEIEKQFASFKEEKNNFSEAHKELLYKLMQSFSVKAQAENIKSKLQGTDYVYRISGWIPAYRIKDFMKDIDELTESRTAIKEYLPSEVRDVVEGREKVPVKLKHGKVVSNFERMVFSYGAPLYGTVDPTPFVAIFFTVLFGIMFGDAGQGLVFFIVGILMCLKKFKLMGWEKFGPVFICMGVSSMIMGLLTGEFFASETVLEPWSRWVTGLFGQPRNQILPLMPSSSQESIKRMFIFFGFTVGVGFIINTTGIIINIINQFVLKKPGYAIFGKTGICGAIFFWYVIFFAVSVFVFKRSPQVFDWFIIGVSLLLTAFGEPLERLVDGERPVLENGLFSAVIAAVVEIIEVISSYLSNTVSFLRVGAFALAHAVLGYIISMMVSIAPAGAGIFISIIGNLIVIVLEGMIVAIQVVRLQYYEFFSKFFSTTGREFKPFKFEYGV